MKSFSTYLLTMFAILFWGLRVTVVITAEMGKDFLGVLPMNETIEIVLLFVFLLCVILIVKRKMLGAVLYLLTYGFYFGGDLTNKLSMLAQGNTFSLGEVTGMIFSMIGIILPLAVLLDLLLDKQRKAHPVDKKTDWFYKNEEFDRKLDDRADKNNYRTM